MSDRSRSILVTHEGAHRSAFTPADWGLLLGPALIWGCSFLFIAEALESFAPAVVSAGRIAFGALTLSLIPAARTTRVSRDDWPRIVVLGVIWMSLPFACFSIAEQWIDSALAGMLNAVMPLTTALVSSVLLRRAPHRRQLLGLLVGFAGAVLIAAPELDGGSSAAAGVALALLAVVSYSFAVNLSIPMTQRYGSLPVIWRTQLAALCVSAPFAVPGLGSIDLHLSGLGSLVILGAGGTALAQVLAAKLVARVGATRGSMITYLMPVVSIAAGVLLRDETVAAIALVGIGVVLLGAALASRSEV